MTRATQTKRSPRRQSLLLFARNFFKHPVMLGSLIPSSRFLINEVLKQINWSRAKVIVEYGPGVGSFTAEILKRMGPNGHLVVIETNRDFVDFLGEALPDKRLHIIHGSAADVDKILKRLGLGSADYVISGIPFSTMPDEVRDAILQKTHSVLNQQGAFLVYQFSRAVLPYLQRFFPHVRQGFQPLNILPAQLFFCVP